MARRSFRPLLNLLLVLGFAAVAYAWWFPAVWHCQTVRFRRFREVAPHFFVSERLPAWHQAALPGHLTAARRRLRAFWGRAENRATIICCGSREEYGPFCPLHEGAGCSLSTPVGAWVVLAPAGLNTDVLAHELAHAELHARLRGQPVPQWFNDCLLYTSPSPRD